MFNAAFEKMQAGRKVTKEEVQVTIEAVDRNADGRISKEELIVVFDKIANNQWFVCPNNYSLIGLILNVSHLTHNDENSVCESISKNN